MKTDSDKTKQRENEDWIDHIADTVSKCYAGRQVVLWGKYQVSDDIEDKLKEKYGIDVAFYVDEDVKKVDNIQVFSVDCLNGKALEYYVVIPLAFYQSVKDKMIRGGYENKTDYYYFSDCVVCQRDDYYEDSHGNKIIGRYQGLKFAFSGFGSCIQIGDHVRFQDTCIYVHNDSKIVIGKGGCFQNSVILAGHSTKVEFGNEIDFCKNDISISDNAKLKIKRESIVHRVLLCIGEYSDILIEENTKIYGNKFNAVDWKILDNARLKIGGCGNFSYGCLIVYENSLLQIGREFSIGIGYNIAVPSHTSVMIGDDCMFSYDIFMFSNDGHSIFDVVSGENINSTDEIAKKRKIDIGSHVWVGMRTTILYNAKIGDGSIVGAMSLVKNTIPNNCIAAGVPAKVIRKDVAWSREAGAENIAKCGYQYVNYTK